MPQATYACGLGLGGGGEKQTPGGSGDFPWDRQTELAQTTIVGPAALSAEPDSR